MEKDSVSEKRVHTTAYTWVVAAAEAGALQLPCSVSVSGWVGVEVVSTIFGVVDIFPYRKEKKKAMKSTSGGGGV